jgi:vacuolar protein sorting-associated protein 8
MLHAVRCPLCSLCAALRRLKRLTGASGGAQPVIRLQLRDVLSKELSRVRMQAGIPSAAVMHSRYTAVGTSRGLVLVFDHFQTLVMTLGQPDPRGINPVRSLDMNFDGDFLIAGHDKGQIVVYDVAGKTVLKPIPDAAVKQIVSVRFTKMRALQFIAVDADGTVNLFSLTKMLFTWTVDKQCLLQGGKDRVMAVAVLFPNDKVPHITDRFSLVAMANEKMVRTPHHAPRPSSARALTQSGMGR